MSEAADLAALAGENFEDLFDDAPCGYLLLRPNGEIVLSNRAISTWTGFSRDELVGKRLQVILPFTTRIFLDAQMMPLLRLQGHVDEVALDLVAKDGTKIPTLANASERRNADGRHLLTRIVLMKAVDRRKYERELLVERDEAQDVAAAEREVSILREQFIAVLGHDLRNPLASISGGVHLLRKEEFSERGRHVLTLIQGSLVRASGLISNVLDFARGRLGGGITLSRENNAPLQAILEQVVAELRAIAADRVIETSFAIDRPVDCDPIRIGQLASNLLGNALTHGSPEQPVRIKCTTRDNVLELAISNGGDAISAEALEHLFQPFFRGKVQASKEGLGLGLYIASQIAKAHGGELTANSSSLETCFSFTMPLSGHASDPLHET